MTAQVSVSVVEEGTGRTAPPPVDTLANYWRGRKGETSRPQVPKSPVSESRLVTHSSLAFEGAAIGQRSQRTKNDRGEAKAAALS